MSNETAKWIGVWNFLSSGAKILVLHLPRKGNFDENYLKMVSEDTGVPLNGICSELLETGAIFEGKKPNHSGSSYEMDPELAKILNDLEQGNF